MRALVRIPALGQKQTFAAQNGTSALPPIADMCSATRHVCFVPIADIALFDHLIRVHTERIWDFEPECFGGFSVDE
jgi:hypothetical protein